MMFETYKEHIRPHIQLWLDTENDHEPMDEKFLNNVASYLYANEYMIEDLFAASKAGNGDLAITLYDYERLTADRRR